MTQELGQKKIFNLEIRTAKFGEDVIRFVKTIPVNEVTKRLISQLVGCGTSIGANYCEADDAESPNDFVHKIGICKKGARETKYFLHMIGVAAPECAPQARILWTEAKELHLILNSIYKKVKNKQK